MANASFKIHLVILLALYAAGFTFAFSTARVGVQYYQLPLEERPHSPLHPSFKPGGAWGHGLGILGSALILLLFLYSLRKRNLRGFRFGKIAYWLNFHIMLGILGPIFVTLHTSFKFKGIVVVSFYSMVAVMLSGFIGRYLYVQIPRALSGDELTMREIEENDRQLTDRLERDHGVDSATLAAIRSISGIKEGESVSGISAIFMVFGNNITRRFKLLRLKKQLLRQHRRTSRTEINHLMKLIDKKSMLLRKKYLLSAIQPVFHYWHVLHKPFAAIMIIIMLVHVAVAVVFGYQWVFSN